MIEQSIEYILKDFPEARYYPKFKLTTWHPQGVLDNALGRQIIEFIEWEEYIQDAPFDRYADFSGITEVQVTFECILEIARHRRLVRQPVKAALFGDKPATVWVAQVYAGLMSDAIMVQVQSFSGRKEAGEWLEVPPAILEKTTATPDWQPAGDGVGESRHLKGWE